ncbi:MAG: DUF2934 domain-containing protein [Chromatiaceae bacterium]|jgi:hypothetical protein|nr:DUF2934 domain-containing protein [Chromatiaceae bacterium]
MKTFDDRFDATAGLEPRRFFRSAAEAAWLQRSVSPIPTRRSGIGADPQRIREAAYFKAERRGFAPGHELEDWLEAEQEADIA